MILNQRLLDWVNWLKLTKRFSSHTLIAYEHDFREFLAFMGEYKAESLSEQALIELKVVDFRSWLAFRNRQGLSHRSTARALSVVRNFYNYLGRQTGKACPALAIVQSSRVALSLPRPLNENQALMLIEDIGEFASKTWIGLRDKALFILLYATGIRISEALSLTGSCLPFSDRLIILGKGKKQRIVPIISQVVDAVREYVKACPFPIESQTPLFLGAKGGKLNASIAQKTLRQYRRTMGLPEYLTPHALRHSCATHLMAQTKDLRAIQELLGHASLSSTQIYTNIDQQQLMQVYNTAHPRGKNKPAPKT